MSEADHPAAAPVEPVPPPAPAPAPLYFVVQSNAVKTALGPMAFGPMPFAAALKTATTLLAARPDITVAYYSAAVFQPAVPASAAAS